MGNHIDITDDLCIKSTTREWRVCKKGFTENKETGKTEEEWKPFIFCSSLKAIVNALADYMFKTSNATNIDELIQAADQISNLLSKKFTASINLGIKHDS